MTTYNLHIFRLRGPPQEVIELHFLQKWNN